VHGGQALMAGASATRRSSRAATPIVITKQASGSAKIDPLMALFDAAHLMALAPQVGESSFWETPPREESAL
jgi:phage terminase large subunit-like protein